MIKKTTVEEAIEQVPGFHPFFERFRMKISIAGKSESTVVNYGRHLAHVALFCKQIPTELSIDQIDSFLYHIKKKYVNPSETFFKLTVGALKFVFKMEGLDEKFIKLPSIKSSKKLPVVLSKNEVINMLNKPALLKHRLLIAILYGCGLRCAEVKNLLVRDIDLQRNTLHVREGKGKKDRYLPLGNFLQNTLKLYIETYKPIGSLFNTRTKNNFEIKFNKTISRRGIQWAVKEAAKKAGIIKSVTTHTLRHTYATHLLEDGLDILSIRDLMGHANIYTTMIYLHIVQPHTHLKFSPIDNLTGVKIIHGIQCSLNFETEE